MSVPASSAAAAQARPGTAITPSRDRLQSRVIAILLSTAITICAILGILATGEQGGRFKVTGISLLFAVLAWLLRSATVGGAICGALACFSITWWTRDLESPLLHSALLPLVLLFLLTLIATRAGRPQKQLRGLAERTGGRTAAQVLANLGFGALVVTPVGAYAGALAGLTLPVDATILAAACIAALAEATADTVSSEIGQAFGRRTYMLTSLRRVHRGTDGGISLVGTAAGTSATLLVVLTGGWSMHMTAKAQALAMFSGLVGFFADSLLGATLERRGWIGNDLVNLTSTAVAGVTLLLLARFTSAFA